MTVSVELIRRLDGTTVVFLIHRNKGIKKKTALGYIDGEVFFKPHSVIYRNENSIGIEKRILKVLKEEGVRWINVKIGKGWYPVPIGYWLNNYDFTIRWRGEDQHHIRIPRIKMLADMHRDGYMRMKWRR